MKFKQAEETNIDLDLVRFLSLEGKWELGLRRMMYGVRVSLSQVGEGFYSLDYCAADDPVFALELLATVSIILERFPEDVTPRQLQDSFPRYERKPINLDPCWETLQRMAKSPASDSA